MKKVLLTVLLALGMTTSVGAYAVDSEVSVGESTSSDLTGAVSGDVNGDGVANILDTLALKNHIVEGKSVEGYTYDTNGDGTSDRVDIIQSKRSTFGLDNFSYYDDGIYDEYEPFNNYAIFNDDIYDNQVWVVIKHQYSDFDKVWSAEDFPVENIDHVYDLTNFGTEDFKDTSKFNKYLILYLKDCSKENVIQMVNDLENSHMVELKKISVQNIWYPIDD
jgi:uncharacterized protein YlbG (UPF0298 family)